MFHGLMLLLNQRLLKYVNSRAHRVQTPLQLFVCITALQQLLRLRLQVVLLSPTLLGCCVFPHKTQVYT